MFYNNNFLQMRFSDPMVSSKGTLQVNVYDRTIGKPVPNSNVRIFKSDSDKATIDNLITNSSGQTANIELQCPPKDYSLDPNNTSKPFENYNIEVSSEGFETTVIQGIEIFDGTEAIQNVELTPKKSNDTNERTISIQENTLWGNFPSKIPEKEVKTRSSETGFVVLDKIVIPETIVVHDGLPDNNNAPNYYVPFKDYIKNVASSEIYSTWPDATIRANILAIISFTLNRVFTEWYRNRGKNFTITSSTAYDHAFSYGRNIFSEISIIVDEMFSTYITKPSIEQPLFSQYCDGKKVSCPDWMTQWGSKDLGDQGYNAVSILKSFYGQDIYLEQATQVNGIPSSFPNKNLQQGSRGSNVRTIQKELNAISKNYPAIPKVNADGIFGQSTTNAVETFQSIFGLPASGIVDYPTWYKISDVYVAVKKLAELK